MAHFIETTLLEEARCVDLGILGIEAKVCKPPKCIIIAAIYKNRHP